jgi:hypothetical protein
MITEELHKQLIAIMLAADVPADKQKDRAYNRAAFVVIKAYAEAALARLDEEASDVA